MTVTEPTAPSFITVWPNGAAKPGTSSLNMFPGQTRPNLVISKIGPNGRVALTNEFGTTHLVADVVGWIPEGSGYVGITPKRLLDTRADNTPLGSDITRRFDMGNNIPADAVAVALNVPITEPTAPTFITTWPTGVDRPTTSNLNAFPGDTRAVAVVVKLGTDQDIDMYNLAGNSHLVVDLVGWYGPGTATPLSLVIGHGLAPTAAELEPGRPLSAMNDGAGPPVDFVTNELITVRTIAGATKIAADWQGQVTSTTPSLAGLDPIHIINFNLTAIDQATLPTVLEALAILSENAEDAGAALQVSDEFGALLFRLPARLLDDGHLAAINVLKVNRQFDVFADPPNPPPDVTITSPVSHTADTNFGSFPAGPPYVYRFTATAAATDTAPDPTNPVTVGSKQQKDRLPTTLARSPIHAQETYIHTLEAAEKEHGDGEAAHRIAFGSLKHSFEKVGDHWEAKDDPGPSDAQDAKRGAEALNSATPTAGGVNANATKAHLLDVARRLDVDGRSTMTKAELVDAIDTANRRATAHAARNNGS